ncbi:MAG: hypothetical protein ABJB12_05440 [Pseudomonadota bacterium]
MAAHATEALEAPSELVSDATAARRTQFIQERLDQGTTSARWWWYGWLGGYSVATLAQGAAGLATHDEAFRASMLVGAAGSGLGILSVIAMPFPPTYAASELRASNGMTAQQRQALALRSLKSCADAENLGRSWLPHALGVAVAAAQGLVLWIGFDRPVDGAESAAVSLVVGEAQIFTQPMRAVDDLASYERQFSRSNGSGLKWRLAPSPRGLALRGEW